MPARWRDKYLELKANCQPGNARSICATARSAIVEVIRDPRDVIVSWIHYYHMEESDSHVGDAVARRMSFFITRQALFYQWYEWMAEFHPMQKFFYADLLADPHKHVQVEKKSHVRRTTSPS